MFLLDVGQAGFSSRRRFGGRHQRMDAIAELHLDRTGVLGSIYAAASCALICFSVIDV
jgi:hypothetical protein